MTRQFPSTRLRRLRSQPFSRRLVQEHTLSAADLIYPTFVIEGKGKTEPVTSMPGVLRKTVDVLVEDAAEAAALGIPLIAIFPVVPAEKKPKPGRRVTALRVWCNKASARSKPLGLRSVSWPTLLLILIPATVRTA